MASYRLFLKRSAERELLAVSRQDLPRILKRIGALATNPRPPGSHKLTERPEYRIRQSDYRILYAIDDAEKKVEIVKIGHRREVYR